MSLQMQRIPLNESRCVGVRASRRPLVAQCKHTGSSRQAVSSAPAEVVEHQVQMCRRTVLAGGLLLASSLCTPRMVLAEESATGSGTKVFFDVNIQGEPAGRIVVELFGDVPDGAARFTQLASGRAGVDYRLSKFNGVLPTYIRNDGVSSLSYSASEASAIESGDSMERLEAELESQTRKHTEPGLVSLIVREKEARPIKERLVAYGGKLVTVQEQAGEAPNGTQFTITTAPSPELDSTNLIVGRVVEGQELLARISALPVNRPRNDNPYFQAGKAMGDKRAVTAERAFYRPFQKVVVATSGVEQ